MDSKRSSSSLSARPSKRAKDQLISDDHVKRLATLPAEMWAVVMDHLDFPSVLSLTATSRTMTYDAAPRVSMLHMDKSYQLHGSVGRRFRDVTDVYIYSLVQKLGEAAEDEDAEAEDITQYIIDDETSRRAVLFLSSFGSLQRVFFGGRGRLRFTPFVDPRIDFSGDSSFKESMARLIDSLSAGFQCGVIPAYLSIKGLFCPKSLGIFDEDSDDESTSSEDCKICPRACQHFPLASVAEFTCGPWPLSFLTEADAFPHLHVCIDRPEIVRFVTARPGGQGLLSSKAYILGLLSRGECFRLSDFEKAKSLIIVSHPQEVVNELKRALPTLGLDAAKLDLSELSLAIKKSFPDHGKRLLSEYWILSYSTRKCLKELGLQSLVEYFGSEANRIELALEFIPQVVNSGVAPNDSFVALIEELVDLQQQIPTQKVIDSGILPLLAAQIGLSPEDDTETVEIDNIIRIFSKLLQGQVEENVAVVMESGFTANLEELFSYEVGDSTFIGVCKALGHIAGTSADFRDQLLQSGIIDKLAEELLDRDNVDATNTCIDTLKLCCCSEDMPAVDFNVTRLSFEFCGYLLSTRVHELVQFACQGLDFYTRDDQSYVSQDRTLHYIIGKVFELLKHESAQLQASAISILDRLLAAEETIVTLSPAFFEQEEVFSYFGALSNHLNHRSEDNVLRACRVSGFLLKHGTKHTNAEDIKCGDVMQKLLMALSKFAMTRPYNLLNLTEPEHALLLCLKNELQQPMGHSLDDAMWQCKQLDNKISKLSEAEIEELHGTGSSVAMKIIGEFIHNQKKLEEALAKKITGLGYSKDVNISQEQLNAIVAELPRTSGDLQDCGLDEGVIAEVGQSILSLVRHAVYNNQNVGIFTFLIDCAFRIRLS